MHHIHIGQAPQYLLDCVFTVFEASGRYCWGWLAQWLMNVVSATSVQLPRTLLFLTLMTLLTPLHSENDPRMYFLIVFTTLQILHLICHTWTS